MKVYGWDYVGVQRGDMLAANVPSQDLYYGVDAIAGELGWECAFTSFSEARKAMICAMRVQRVDEELIDALRTLRASQVPVTEELT